MTQAPSVKTLFDSLDGDKDGQLSYNELNEAFSHLGIAVDYDQLMAVAEHVDPNGTGKVSYEGFLVSIDKALSMGQVVPEGPAPVPATADPGVAQAKERLIRHLFSVDARGAGFVSVTEFQDAMDACNIPMRTREADAILATVEITDDGKVVYGALAGSAPRGGAPDLDAVSAPTTVYSPRREEPPAPAQPYIPASHEPAPAPQRMSQPSASKLASPFGTHQDMSNSMAANNANNQSAAGLSVHDGYRRLIAGNLNRQTFVQILNNNGFTDISPEAQRLLDRLEASGHINFSHFMRALQAPSTAGSVHPTDDSVTAGRRSQHHGNFVLPIGNISLEDQSAPPTPSSTSARSPTKAMRHLNDVPVSELLGGGASRQNDETSSVASSRRSNYVTVAQKLCAGDIDPAGFRRFLQEEGIPESHMHTKILNNISGGGGVRFQELMKALPAETVATPEAAQRPAAGTRKGISSGMAGVLDHTVDPSAAPQSGLRTYGNKGQMSNIPMNWNYGVQ